MFITYLTLPKKTFFTRTINQTKQDDFLFFAIFHIFLPKKKTIELLPKNIFTFYKKNIHLGLAKAIFDFFEVMKMKNESSVCLCRLVFLFFLFKRRGKNKNVMIEIDWMRKKY